MFIIKSHHKLCVFSQYYSSHAAYAQSKLAVVLSTYALSHQLQTEGAHVTVNCIHPGVVDTQLYEHVHPLLLFIQTPLAKLAFLVCTEIITFSNFSGYAGCCHYSIKSSVYCKIIKIYLYIINYSVSKLVLTKHVNIWTFLHQEMGVILCRWKMLNAMNLTGSIELEFTHTLNQKLGYENINLYV